MPIFRKTEYLNVSPQIAWDFVSDLRRGPEYVTPMLELISISEEPIKKGTIYRELSLIGPSKSETEWTISEFDPPKHQVHETHSSELFMRLEIDFEPQGEGTKLTYVAEYKLFPKLRPFGWLLETLFVSRMMNKILAQTVTNRTKMVEAENS